MIINRNLFLDKLKGLAIVLVVWGHCLQFCTKQDVLGNRLFELIYTFHMPLFMAVSGYLYYNSINRKSLKELVMSRTQQLLIPFCIWSLFYLLIFRWEFSHTPVQWIKNYIYNLPFFFWFIWSLLIGSVATIIINKLFKDRLMAYILFFVAILFIPNGLGFFYTKFMIPYFFAGYLVHKYSLRLNKFTTAASVILFILMWYFWKSNYYIYTTSMVTSLKDYNGMFDDFYRYLAGFAGILAFVAFVKQLPNFKIFEVLGRYTLGIYFISCFLNSYLYLLKIPYQPALYNFVYTPLVATIITGICIGISALISKNKFLNQYLLGGR